MAWRCPCGEVSELECDEFEEDYYDDYDSNLFAAVWIKFCPHCGRKFRVKDIYKRVETEIEEVSE